jgi:hypothetical protein
MRTIGRTKHVVFNLETKIACSILKYLFLFQNEISMFKKIYFHNNIFFKHFFFYFLFVYFLNELIKESVTNEKFMQFRMTYVLKLL